MHIRTFGLLLMISYFFYTGSSSGQNTEKKRNLAVQPIPAHTLQFNINYNKSLLELSGTFNDNVRSEYIYKGGTFGSDKGFGVSLVSKIGIGEENMIRFNQVLAYNRILSYPFSDNTALADIGEANYNAFTGALGMEYVFTPVQKFRVYLGGEINASIINGDIRIWFERKGHPMADSNASYSISSSFRIGYGLNAGTEYILNRNFGLNIGIKFLNLNAFKKNAEGSNSDKEFQLRDDDNPSLNFAGYKNFSLYSIIGGVNFYFGTKAVK